MTFILYNYTKIIAPILYLVIIVINNIDQSSSVIKLATRNPLGPHTYDPQTRQYQQNKNNLRKENTVAY